MRKQTGIGIMSPYLLSFACRPHRYVARSCRTDEVFRELFGGLFRLSRITINASPSNTRGGSRLRESRMYGFVRQECSFAAIGMLSLR
jgi:hypothetical protein